MAKRWIQCAIQYSGALTRKAKASGMTVSAFMVHPPKGIVDTAKRQTNLAKTLKSLHRGR